MAIVSVSSLRGRWEEFVEDVQEEYDEMREDYYAGLEDRYFLTFEQAKEQKMKIDFDNAPPAPAPSKPGVSVVDTVKVADIVPYIDWVRFQKMRTHPLKFLSQANAYLISLLP